MIQIDRRQATVAVVREVGEVGNGIVESGKIFKAMPLHRTFFTAPSIRRRIAKERHQRDSRGEQVF